VSQLLSRDEVDALLGGVADGTVPPGGRVRAAHVVPIDVTSQTRSLRGSRRGLELVVDRFARAVRLTLGGVLGKLPTVEPATAELVRFACVSARLVQPVSVHVFRMPPLDGQGTIIVPLPLAALLFEASLGGDARRRIPVAPREFSAIEQRIVGRLATRFLHDLRDAWRPIATIDFALVGSEPAAAAVVVPHEIVLLIELAVGIDTDETVPLRVCVPDVALDPFRHAVDRPGGWSDRMVELLGSTEVELVAELGMRRLRLAEVLALRAGDVLRLGTAREGPVLVRVEGRPVFVGAPGVSGSSNAVRITATV
jgi:flagellar motor switch protein FliM